VDQREDQAALAIAALARPDLAGSTFRIGERLTGHELAEGVGAGTRPRGAPRADGPRGVRESVVPLMGEQAGRILAADYGALVDRPRRCAWTPIPKGSTASSASAHPGGRVGALPGPDWEAAAAAAA
jgi:hypothetical protein